ncbi:hypothetical protein P5G51_007305 [Virgibacillus sp. 179-BFC.A HS]|uniref:Spore coat protein YutH n=1 Tax=Tigheibacillus jepli TaxID=3035914 RepID=A0ABU5CGZ5_9BACI|nr:hypothetical protein [Virgibacillus sp. 179-BFC.A HS]MDY0405236.1 hypothetical protein [Virgibacillus sp. 179-BFC.A HS]
MEHVFQSEYGISVRQSRSFGERESYTDGTYMYFILPSSGDEAIDMEKATLAYHLQERSFKQIALPIQKLDGSWYITGNEKQYLVTRVLAPSDMIGYSQGKALAQFHRASEGYAFVPHKISSYGQWKQLWVNKLTVFEKQLEKAANKHPGKYYRLVMDIFPYVIGRTENAIQYMHETEADPRYHGGDRGVIAFRRFEKNAFSPVIWFNELVYDHPVRDVAEYMRACFLEQENVNEATEFLRDYQAQRNLSIFSMRMLYARLLFPADLLDCLEKGFRTSDEKIIHTSNYKRSWKNRIATKKD